MKKEVVEIGTIKFIKKQQETINSDENVSTNEITKELIK